MKSERLMKLIVVFAFLLVTFVIGRGVWQVATNNLISQEQQLFENHNLTLDEFVAQMGSDIHRAKVLSETCLLVAECTPSQHVAAVKLAKANETRLESYYKYQQIRSQAVGLYNQILASRDPKSPLIPQLMALRDPFMRAMAAANYDRNLAAMLFDQGNLPKRLVPVFQILR